MSRVPQSKWSAMFQGEDAHRRKNIERNEKQVGVALGAVTRARAKTYGFAYDKWKRTTEAAIAVDYKAMRRTADVVAAMFRRPAEVRVKADDGTNLRFRLAGEIRTPHVDDGVISEQDLSDRNPTTSLPAGAVFLAPIQTGANGTLPSHVRDPQDGTPIERLTWAFRDARRA